MDFLKGRKTYILAAAAAVVTAAHSLGWIDAEMWATLLGFLGIGSVATLRAGIKNDGS